MNYIAYQYILGKNIVYSACRPAGGNTVYIYHPEILMCKKIFKKLCQQKFFVNTNLVRHVEQHQQVVSC